MNPGSPTGADFFRGGISKILFDPTHAGVAYASMFDYGLYRATTAGGAWTRIYSINNPGAAATSATNRVEFATASLPVGSRGSTWATRRTSPTRLGPAADR